MQRETIERDCDLCGSGERRFVTVENDYPISKCTQCSFVYVSRIPKIEDGKVLGEYYTGSEDEIEDNRLKYAAVTDFLLDEITKQKKTGKLLDLGCGYGFFLAKARDNGWEVYGTDLSEIAVNYVKQKHSIPNVRYAELSDTLFPDVKFDAINLTNVLEHVPSPTQIIEVCRERLVDDGLLIIRVPNIDFNELKQRFTGVLKLLRLGKGGELSYLASSPPVHLCGFTTRTLQRYFEKCGLQVVEIKPSKLSGVVNEMPVYRAFELFVGLLYRLSFRKINVSPTIIAIAKRK